MTSPPIYSPSIIRALIASGAVTRSMMSAKVQEDFKNEFKEAERIAKETLDAQID